jgi:hypothetical protein
VGFEVAVVGCRFILLVFAVKDSRTTVHGVGEIVLSNSYVLLTGVVNPGVEDVYAGLYL